MKKNFAQRMMLIHKALKESNFKPMISKDITESVRIGIGGPTFKELGESIK